MNENKKICVISMENHTGHLLYIVAHANHLAYCRKNGYEYFESTDFSRYPIRDHAHWYKFPVIIEAMQKHPDMDYYLWIDIDAYFTGMDIRLESFIPDEKAHILMSKDTNETRRHGSMFDQGFCAGVVLMRNSAETRRFIRELASDLMGEMGSRMRKAGIIHYRDQEMLQFLSQVGDYKGIITEIPSKSFQSYLNPKPISGVQWEKGDCVVHLCGCNFQKKVELLQKMGYDLSTGEVGINA